MLKEMPLNLVDYARVLQAQGYRVLTARSAEVAGTGSRSKVAFSFEKQESAFRD